MPVCVGLIMEASEALSEKILEERQIEKFSQFIEKYEVDVETLRSKLRPRKHAAATAATTADVEESVSLVSLTGGLGAAARLDTLGILNRDTLKLPLFGQFDGL